MSITSVYDQNFFWINQNFPPIAKLIGSQPPVVELTDDKTGELWLNDQLLFEQLDTEISIPFVKQLVTNPRRVRTPRVESGTGSSSIIDLAEDFVDKHDGPFVKHLPIFSDYSTDYDLAKSRDVLVLGSLFLLPFLTSFESQDASETLIESITLVESDLDQFKALLCLIDFEKFVNFTKERSIAFHLIYQQDEESLITYTYSYLTQEIPSALHSLTILLQPKSHPLLSNLYAWFFSQSGIGYRFLGTLGTSSDELNQVFQGLWSTYSVDNKSSLVAHSSLVENADIPVLLVAGGPSLDMYIHDINRIQDKFFVVAAGSSLGSLLKANIVPDACVFLERGSTEYSSVNGLVEDGYLLDDITLITSETTDPRLRSLFNRCITYHRPTSSLCALFTDEYSHALLHAGPEAANAALDAVINFGFTEIHALGCDFSAQDRFNARANNTIGDSPRALMEPSLSNLGNTVYTQPSLSMTRDLFEASILFYNQISGKELTIYRYGEGLPIKGTISTKSLSAEFPSAQIHSDLVFQGIPNKVICSFNDSVSQKHSLNNSLNIYVDKAKQVIEDIFITRRYSHKLIAPLMDLYSRDDDNSHYDLVIRRIMRQIFYSILAPVFDSVASGNDNDIEHCKIKAMSSLDLLSDFIAGSFDVLYDELSRKPRLNEWSPNKFRSKLLEYFRQA